MASAEFLEQALSTDVDENAVNAIVGSLENQLVPSISPVSLQNNFINVIPNNISNISSASSIIGHKYIDQSDEVVGANFQSIFSAFPTLSNIPLNNVELLNTEFSQPQTEARNITQNILNTPVNFLSSQASIVHPVQGIAHINKQFAMQPPVVLKPGNSSGQVNMQTGMVSVPMTVNSSMANNIPNVMTINKPGQNVVVTTHNMGPGPSLLPNVQILNTRPGAPSVGAQKSVATVSPRVVIGTPQVVGTRAAVPGITLQTLQSLQQGQQGHLLLKTENGQYQLLRVGPAPGASTLTAPQPQTLRLSTVPAPPGVVTVSTSVAVPGQIPGQMPTGPIATPVAVSTVSALPPQAIVQQQPMVTTQKPLDNTKEKCRNFLANLLDLSSKEPKSVECNVRNLIQELIDAQVEPEEFCDRLEKLLNASPQPCLIGFLRKSLPLLRQSMCTKELVIEGINPPSPHIAFSSIPAPVAPSLPQPVIAATNLQMLDDDGYSPPTLTTLQPPSISLPMPFVHPPNPFNVYQMQPTYVAQPKPPTKPGSSIAVLQNIPIHTKINVTKVGKTMTVNSKANFTRPGGPSAALSTVLTGKSVLKDKEKKSTLQFTQPFGDDKMTGDDDINDVAAMGGVNLAEETQRILGSTELIGTQIRSCKDEYLLPIGALQNRVKLMTQKHGLDEASPEVSGLISHAVNEHIKGIVEKLATVAQHRSDLFVKSDTRYDITQDVKGQMKFLEELDRVDRKRREDSEREMLLRAAKSRSKNEDPEQAKLKAKAKEMQRAELEELRQREANLTALQAIGPRKKARLDGPGGSNETIQHHTGMVGYPGRSQMALRTRLKRINLRDMIFLLEQEKETSRATILYRSYLK